MTRTATVLPALNPRTATPAQWAQYELALALATATAVGIATAATVTPTAAHICHDDTETED